MTKIKNTKKGMAKKTLSMSLVVAMLATSNVPVWAAEFSDGTDVATFASEAEAPAVEDFDTANTENARDTVVDPTVNVSVEGAVSDEISIKAATTPLNVISNYKVGTNKDAFISIHHFTTFS